MSIKIHRGTHQIGGCVTEYEYEGWRLFVDYGEELPGGPKSGDLHIEGLTHGDISKSACIASSQGHSYCCRWVLHDIST